MPALNFIGFVQKMDAASAKKAFFFFVRTLFCLVDPYCYMECSLSLRQ